MEQKEIIERILLTCDPEIRDAMMEEVVRNECVNAMQVHWGTDEPLRYEDRTYKRYELEKDPLETIRKWEAIIAARKYTQ